MKIKVEHGIPMLHCRGRWNEFKEKFSNLKVGDSLFITPDEGEMPHQLTSRLGTNALRRFIGKYSLRLAPDGVRVWRTKP